MIDFPEKDSVLCPLTKIYDRKVSWKNFTSSFYKFNNVHFWAYIKQMKSSNPNFNPSNELINEKSINLNDNETAAASRSVLYVGLNPEENFQVYARLEKQSIDDCFMLTAAELKILLKLLFEQRNNVWNETPLNYSTIGDRFVIRENESKNVELMSCENGRCILFDKSSIKKLIRLDSFIKRIIFLLEKDTSHYEKLFLNLLYKFCLGKTLTEACELSWTDAKYCYLDAIANLKCNCVSENFTIEIATKCGYWFAVAVQWFLKTLMLAESERLATFKLRWPHFWQYVNTEEMAKCGLYYTGVGDNVRCAFCSVLIHKWNRGDKPVKDHFKYSPKCPFLYNYKNTSNVSNVGDIGELDKLIALLPNERGTDEVDR